MAEDDARALSSSRKRRGVARASITHLRTRLSELVRTSDQPGTLDSAKRLLVKMESLDKDFKTLHLAVVDLTEGGEALQDEQQALDAHDDEISQLEARIQKLISTCSSSPHAGPRRVPFTESVCNMRNSCPNSRES